MRQFPLVSVITPSFNQGRFIAETIESVLSQDYPNIEYLIIDGGSTDNTLETLRRYEDKLIWISERDKGQADAINKGFRKAQGDILCWLNSDDTYEAGAISKAVESFIENPDVMMVYGEGNEVDENGVLIHRFPATQKYDLWALIYIWDYILQPTTFFRKAVFDKIEMLDENLHWCMDWDLWIRIGSQFKVAHIDYVFANSRIYSDTKTKSGGMRRLNEIAAVMRKYGRRKYPLGYFIFAEDTIETIIKQRSPIIYLLLCRLLHRARAALSKKQHNYQGVYQDGWLGKNAHFMFTAFDYVKRVKFEVQLPEIQVLFPNALRVKVNGGVDARYHLAGPGKFDFDILMNRFEDRPIEVELQFRKTFKAKNEKRRMSCLLRDIRYIAD